MLSLDDPLWTEMLYAGGSARVLPSVIRQCRACVDAGNDLTPGLMLQLSGICHQWSTYDSTCAVVPHLVHISQHASPNKTARIWTLSWIGWCVACLRLNRTTAPQHLVDWFESSVLTARALIAESLPYVDVTERKQLHSMRGLLAAFATCHGNPSLGFVLFELESGGTKCAQCGVFFQPMESSFNPFYIPKASA